MREKLRELTGRERATDVFNPNAENKRHYGAIFGKPDAVTQAEGDFFRGVGYLHLGVQFLRNEKAHTLATFVEPNLAIHYLALASLAYDMITRHPNDASVREVEDFVLSKRSSYRSSRAFYTDLEQGKWLRDITLPEHLASASFRRALKAKWLADADLTRSWNESNLLFMRLELVIGEITVEDIDRLVELPTVDDYGNDQAAGLEQFLRFVESEAPEKLSAKAKQLLPVKRTG